MLLFSVDGNQGIGRKQDSPAGKPVSRIGNKITNHPVLIIEVEFLGLSYHPVKAIELVTLERF
jgi:hypothetical protein